MTYYEVFKNLSDGGEIRYHFNGFVDGNTYNLFDSYGDDLGQLHPKVIDKIFRIRKTLHIPYAIEGSEETGWLRVI